MPRHQSEVDGHTILELEQTLQQIRAAGAPDNAELRIRTGVSFHQDGPHARTVTARWDTRSDNSAGS